MTAWLRDSKRWWLFSLVLVVLGGGWAYATRVPAGLAGAGQIPSPRAGFPAPDFTLKTAADQPLTLSDFRGRVVILNLWASWCGPCRAEMPALQQVYAANQARGLVVLGVNSTIQDTAANAQTFVDSLGLTFPIVLDLRGVVGGQYQLRALPSTFFIDRRGVIRNVVLGGPQSLATLAAQVDDLLREAP